MFVPRPQQTQIFVDKENGAFPGAGTHKKGTSSYISSAAAALKTPGVKMGHLQQSTAVGDRLGKSVMQTAVKSKGQVKAVHTVALEPGARVLGAKDGNNNNHQHRQRQGTQTVGRGDKGKGREVNDCSEIVPKVLFKDVLATRKNDTTTTTSASTSSVPLKTPGPVRQTAKTPARSSKVTRTAFKTPSLTGARSKTGPQTPAFSIFKTPSPNELKRRRQSAITNPVAFEGLFKPTSLRVDGVQEEEEDQGAKMEPTFMELYDQHLDTVDEDQEVEYAGLSARDINIPYDPGFEMPDWSKLNLRDLCFQLSFDNRVKAEQEDAELYGEILAPEIPDEELPSLHILDSLDEPSLFATESIPGDDRRGPQSPNVSTASDSRITNQAGRPNASSSLAPISSSSTRLRAGLSAANRQRPGLSDAPSSQFTLSQSRSARAAPPTTRMHSRTTSATSFMNASTASRPGLRTAPLSRKAPAPKDPLDAFKLDLAADDFKLVL